MPPCEALTTTAPRASASATRVMLSAMTIGAAEEGIAGELARGRPKIASSRRLGASAPCTSRMPSSPGDGQVHLSKARAPEEWVPTFAGTATLIPDRALRLRLRTLQEGGGAVFDAALDCLCEQVQEPRQFEIDPDKIIVDLDATGDRLHHCDDPEIEAVIVPGIVERFDVGPYLGTDRGEPLVDAPLGPVAAELVRDRDGDRFGRGQHMGGNTGVADRAPARFDAGRTSQARDHSPMPELKVRSEIAGSVW